MKDLMSGNIWVLLNKSLFTILISEMAERGSGSYLKGYDYLNTKRIQREKQFRKVQKKISKPDNSGGCRATRACGDMLLPLCLSSSAFQVDGQMVKNRAASFLLFYLLNSIMRQFSACHQGRKKHFSHPLTGPAGSHP